jgi:DNA polymerase-3 subunit epsilon
MRQIVLDTETTGLEPSDGHRIIEIGCVELVNRRLTGNTYHQYINPDRTIDAGAIEVHGITNESLADKPGFADVTEEFLTFIRDAELIIHNAPFDVGFINHEFSLLETSPGVVTDYCTVLDTLTLARRMHPGQRNSLDALWGMTGGQVSLSLDGQVDRHGERQSTLRRLDADRQPLKVVRATPEEGEAHDARLDVLDKACDSGSVWRRLEADVAT